MSTTLSYVALPVATADGEFMAFYSPTGLAELNFPKSDRAPSSPVSSEAPSKQVREWHKLTTAAVKNILAGKVPKTLPPMIPAGTAFQKRVWQAMGQIGVGQTRSYGEVAAAIGQPKAVRAVGGACGSNPIPLLIPCHRVIAANQKIGGFGGGLGWKSRLLEGEGVYL